MDKFYALFGIFILGLFLYSWQMGTSIVDPFAASPHKPQGPGQYHK